MTESEIVALIGMAGMVLVAIIQSISQISLSSIKKRLDKSEKHNREQYLGILRLTVMSEEMPVSERIIAGKKYINEGGNGDVQR